MAFSSITVPLDGSEFAEAVLRTAEDLAVRLGASIRLVSVVDAEDDEAVIEYGVVGGKKPVATRRVQRKKLRAALEAETSGTRRYLDRIVDRIQRRTTGKVDVSIDIRVGDAAEEIIESSTGEEGRAIAMATHGWTGAGENELGSVAERVLRAARCPVIAVRPDGPGGTPGQLYRIRTVVVGLDGSAVAELPISLAVKLARALEAELVLLKASGAGLRYSTQAAIEKAEEDDRRYLQRIIERVNEPGLKLRGEGTSGAAASDLVRFGRDNPGSLIVLRSRVRGGRTRVVLGSVTDTVIRAGTCPVLVFPSQTPARQA